MVFFKQSGLFLIALIMSTCICIVTSAAHAQTSTTESEWSPTDDDLRILEIRVGKYKLDDVLPAYQHQDSLLIPIGLISELLDIAVNSRPGDGTANGFMLQEDNTLFLDTSRSTVTLKGIVQSYDKNLVYVLDDDIYVESTLFSKWFPIDLEIDLFASIVWVTSEIPLPFVKQIERKQRIDKALARLGLEQTEYPRHYEPYQQWSTPFIDQTLQFNARRANSTTTSNTSYTTYVTADLLKMESSLYVFGNDDDIVDDVRFTMGRKDPESQLLGFMNATEYGIGHVAEPRTNLITLSGKTEPGIRVSNFPLTRQQEFDRHRFRGDLLPGWEVELYRNNALIGYQPAAIDGQYDFKDVALLFGNNHFRLMFYGPQGQVREENQHFELGQSLTQPGKHYYLGTITDDEDGGSRTVLHYDVGLTKQLSAAFNAVSIPLDISTTTTEQHNYLQAGIRSFWEQFFITLDAISDSDGGSAVELDLQTRVGSTILGFTQTQLKDFFSEEFLPTQAAVEQQTRFRIDSAIPATFLPRIPVSLEYKRQEFESGDIRDEYINLISTNVHNLAISNQLLYVQTSGLPDLFTGTLQLSQRVAQFDVRGIINYELDPASEFTNVSITARPPQKGEYSFTYGLNHSLLLDSTELSFSATKPVGKYSLSLGGRYNTENDIAFDARFSISLGKEPRSNRWQSNALSMASRGSVSTSVFIDNDQDGILSENDEPLENISFTINGGRRNIKTDENGTAFITNLQQHKPTNLAIAMETLSDPLWTAALDGVRIIPRPGQTIKINFPIFTSGEIDGTAYLEKDGRRIGVGNVNMELVDENGRVIKHIQTEYDGFYVISNIPLGKYSVRVSPQQLQELGLRSESTSVFQLSSDRQFESGIDITLSKP